MTKKLIPILLLTAISLSSCGILFDKTEQAEEPTAVVEATAETSTADENTTESSESEEPLTDADNPCVTFNALSLLLNTPYPGLPEVSEDDYTVGPDDAILTFLEYSEPQCPYCAQLEPILTAFQAMYPDDVRLVFRFRPFSADFHDKSIIASQAMVAAGIQGKFTELKNFLFERQYQDAESEASMPETDFWAGLPAEDFDAWLEDQVPALGIDAGQLLADMYSDEVIAKVQQFKDEADELGINGTPYLFINGYQWRESSRSIELFTIYLKLLKNQENEMDACPPTIIDENKTYTATISTTQGDIVAELYPDKAPYAVNSFVFLADEGWYNDLPILALATENFILSGDPTGTVYGGAGYAYLDEESDLTFDEPGMLSVYSIGPGYGLNGSVFFINKDTRTDNERTIFGKVIEGLDILDKFEIQDPVTDKVLEITITEE